jgi:phospholipase C
MRPRTRLATLAAAVGAVAVVTTQSMTGALAHGDGADHHRHSAPLDHIFVIMLENHSRSSVIDDPNAPYLTSLAHHYGMADNYYGVTHPSMPNYIASIAGDNFGIQDDNVENIVGLDRVNLVDQLESHHIGWDAYMEDLPADKLANYSPSKTDALYAKKHDPFVLFDDVKNDPQRLAHVRDYTQLGADLNSRSAPQFVWITPNQCNNMHGGTPSCPFPDTPTDANQVALYRDGDTFLKTWVTAIMHSKAWTGHSAIFVTWDESSFADDAPFGPNDTSGCCDAPRLPATPPNPSSGGGGDLAGGSVYGGGHVPMIVITRNSHHHMTDDTATNHYSLLQTIEQNWNLPFLGNASDTQQVQSLAPLLNGH